MVLFSWVCRLSFYLAQAFKILTKKHELHYCSALIEVRSGGTIGAYAITWSRPIAMTNVPFANKNDLINLKISENIFCTNYSCFYKRLFVLKRWNYFCSKPHFWPKINIIMFYDNVFTIIVWDFITNARKLQKLQLFPLLYPNQKPI